MLFVKNGGFHRASNIIVIEAVSFLFSNISKIGFAAVLLFEWSALE